MLTAIDKSQKQFSILAKTVKMAFDRRSTGQPNRQRSADRVRKFQPTVTNRSHTFRAPALQQSSELPSKQFKKNVGIWGVCVFGNACRKTRGNQWSLGKVDSYSDYDCISYMLKQYSRNFGAIKDNITGPFYNQVTSQFLR